MSPLLSSFWPQYLRTSVVIHGEADTLHYAKEISNVTVCTSHFDNCTCNFKITSHTASYS